jgi:antitoxin (DNA-binding transcriptional repressor) of toxin-antitoxin stability system
MYIIMKPLKVAEARARFGEILDDAESGRPVTIERRGVRFRLTTEPESAPRVSRGAFFEHVDPQVLAGQWTWKPAARGLRYSARRKRR